MSLSDNVSEIVGLIYRGSHDKVAWTSALDSIISVTGSRFIMNSTVDLGKSRYYSSDFYGADDALFLDGVRDYKDYKYQTDPTLAYGRANPNAGFVSLPIALNAMGANYDDNAYSSWTKDVLGVGASMVCYTQYQQDYILGVSLHPSAARGAHSKNDIRLFQMLFRHIELAVQTSFDPIDLQSTSEAILLLTREGLISAQNIEAEKVLALNDGIEIRHRRLHFNNPRDETVLAAYFALPVP